MGMFSEAFEDEIFELEARVARLERQIEKMTAGVEYWKSELARATDVPIARAATAGLEAVIHGKNARED